MNKKTAYRLALLCGSASLSGVIGASHASASLLIADGFDYPAGNKLDGNIETASGQTWTLTGSTDGAVISSGSVTYTGTNAPPALPGDSSSDASDASVKLANSSTTNAERIALGGAYSSGTLYYSLTLKVTGLGTNSGSFIAGFNNLTGAQGTALTTAGTALYLKQDGTTGDYLIGVEQKASAAASPLNYGTTDFTTGETLFIVGSYTFSSTGDSSNLYVFAPTDTVPETEPATPYESSQGTTGTVLAAGNDDIQSFFLRNQAGAPATTLVDDVRVGTSWSDVISGTAVSVPEPASIGLMGLAMSASLIRRRRAQA